MLDNSSNNNKLVGGVNRSVSLLPLPFSLVEVHVSEVLFVFEHGSPPSSSSCLLFSSGCSFVSLCSCRLLCQLVSCSALVVLCHPFLSAAHFPRTLPENGRVVLNGFVGCTHFSFVHHFPLLSFFFFFQIRFSSKYKPDQVISTSIDLVVWCCSCLGYVVYLC